MRGNGLQPSSASDICVGYIFLQETGRLKLRKIVCISCVKSKRAVRSRAEDLYTSPLFRMMLEYAKSLNPDHIFILSAKYGVIALSDEVDPYEQTLNRMKKAERLAWADRVLAQLGNHVDLDNDDFVFLAGQRYRENLASHIKRCSVPMEGLPFGKQLQWLGKRVGYV